MAEEEKEEEPKKGGLMKIITMTLGVIGLIGLGLGAGYFFFGGKPANPSEEIEEIIERKMKEAEEAKAAEEAANAGPSKKEAPEVEKFITTYYEFPGNFTTNLRGSKQFLQITVGVSTQYDEEVMVNVESHQLALRGIILGVMSEYSQDDVAGREGKQALADSIKDALNIFLEDKEGFGGVEGIHFTSFVLQ